MRRVAAIMVVGVLAAAGCASSGTDEAGTVTAVVQRMEAGRTVCVDPLGDSTPYCTTTPDSRNLQGVHIGDCVEVSRNLAVVDALIKVLPERSCS